MNRTGAMEETKARFGQHVQHKQDLELQKVSTTLTGKTMSNIKQNISSRKIAPLRQTDLWRRSLRLRQFCVVLLVILCLRHFLQLRRPLGNSNKTAIPPHAYHVHHEMPQPRIEPEQCDMTNTLKTRQFGFNITNEGPNQWQLLDSVQTTRKNFRGRILVERGAPSQGSDIEVHVTARSSEQARLDDLTFAESKSTLTIGYDLEEMAALCTDFDIVVHLRPNIEQVVELFEIRTNTLDIWFEQGLGWKVNNFITHTSYGETRMMAFRPFPDRMVAHNISVSSTYGLLTGEFVLPKENLELHNTDGEIGVYIFPNLLDTTERIYTKSISVSTGSGPLTLMSSPSLPWPVQDYTHRLSISSVSGDIRAQTPHGSFTNYSSVSGDITCHIQPFSTNLQNAKNEIYTKSMLGNLDVRVGDVFQQSHRQYNPLLNTVSEHSVEKGRLELAYGHDWFGDVEANIGQGKLEFGGTSMKKVQKKKGSVKGRRGSKGESMINAHVVSGELDLKLGL
ncbi:hypothetical protein BDV95DRAFT_317461 [Massariosphaeria phaeospora]|uniref:Uncharacterized protein n=1 Tax=Massariosphaeria phaeospora TaxID=100035 RepID=A0A7C8ICX8_9PLEO|nr:hypothetical protein BDV95DRAFT_317461 [Massariosphaeria phaeospora]